MGLNPIIDLANHCLHLCHNSNFEEVTFSYLMGADVFVTNEINFWENKFKENGIKSQIKSPDEIKEGDRIIVDGSSFSSNFDKLENRWKKQKKAICIYNIDKIDSSVLKDLVNAHDKMLLSINKIKVFSDKNIEKEIDLDPEIVESIVKRELRNIVISLLLSAPMSGTDLVKILYKRFKVFISPGMLYPTLHELEKSELLKYEYKLKNKVYTVQKKEQAKLLLEKHAKVNTLLSEFLVKEQKWKKK